MVTVYFDHGKSFFLTTVLALTPDNNQFIVDIGSNDLGPLLGKVAHDRPPHALACTRYKRHFIQQFHRVLPPARCRPAGKPGRCMGAIIDWRKKLNIVRWD